MSLQQNIKYQHNQQYSEKLQEQQNLELKEEQAIDVDCQIIRFPRTTAEADKCAQIKQQAIQIQVIQQVQGNTSSFPWLSSRTQQIQNPLIKLHNQTIQFYLFCIQEQQRHIYLQSIFSKFQCLMFKAFHTCEVLAPFLTNKVYLKNTQVEVFIVLDQITAKDINSHQTIRNCLIKAKFNKINLFQVKPQQPHRQTKLGFTCLSQDQSYNFQIKIVTNQWLPYLSHINQLLDNNLQAKYLFIIFDAIVRQRGLQNAIKSYLTFGLIAVFLHQRRKQKSRSLTQNLIKFLQYFGIGPFTQRKISYIGKKQGQIDHNEFEIKVQSQNSTNANQFSFWISNKTQISSHLTRELFSILRNRYRLISNYNFSNSISILSALVNPCNQQFRY